MDDELVFGIKITAIVIGLLMILVGLGFAGCGIHKSYERYQIRTDAENEVHVNEIKIKQTHQLVEVEKQKASIREAEANGIAAAQQIINATLTDRYLQHEAIRAQMEMSKSPNHTQIYIPVGNNGIPIVHTIDEDR